MKLEQKQIETILLEGSYISREDLQKAKKDSLKLRTTLDEYLVTEGIVTKDILGQAIAEWYGTPYADLNSVMPHSDQVQLIAEETAKKYRVVVFSQSEKKDVFVITTDNPKQVNLKNTLEKIFSKKKITIAYSLPEDIDSILASYKKPLATRFGDILKRQRRVAPELIDEIVRDALLFAASDIHFEPQDDVVIVRFRIDGVLREAGRIPKPYYASVLNRIKVKAHLPIDEHHSALDGAIRAEYDGRQVDMRISIAPMLDGEKVVIRLLAEYVRGFTLTDLGLDAFEQKTLIEGAEKPFGMVLVVGPTGSGKTTTLYSVLKRFNTQEVNISTIEDPVEYKIFGVNHMQVNAKTNITFAKGLRTIVRQDPDIILVGEIRDQETAEIAVNAALTGHLLFSTFHANDAATALPRLADMGIEPYLLSSTVHLVIAQRLLRRICDSCRFSSETEITSLLKRYPQISPYLPKNNGKMNLYKGKGCKNCNETGFKGRTGIFEFIRVTPRLQDLLLTQPSSKQIWEVATSDGSKSLFENGMNKVKNGLTTISELLRVASPSERPSASENMSPLQNGRLADTLTLLLKTLQKNTSHASKNTTQSKNKKSRK